MVTHGLPLSSIQDARDGLTRGTFSAVELIEASLEAIRDRDTEIGAFIDVRDSAARREAAGIRCDDPRPLAGIPVAVKENRGVAGALMTFGSRALAGRRAEQDSPSVARARAAGAIVVGTTSMSEFGLLPGCEPAAHTPTRNPLTPQMSTGGSSGGSAAAVAAGMVPLALGNDSGGSLRIPAAWCGLATVVPSARGRRHDAGHSPAIDGFLASSIDDVLLAEGAAGMGAQDLTTTVASASATAIVLGAPPAMDSRLFDGEVVTASSDVLAEAGVRVETDEHFWARAPHMAFFPSVAPSARRLVMRTLGVDGDDALQAIGGLEPYTRSFLQHAGRVTPESEARAVASLEAWAREVEGALPRGSVLVCPTTLSQPLSIGAFTGDFSLEDSGGALGLPTTFTWIASALGWWSAAIPVARDHAIPGSIQILAPRAHLGAFLHVCGVLAEGTASAWDHHG
jgi:amidase